MSTSPNKKLHDLLEDFGVAMLVTRTTDGNMRGRPMALAEAEPEDSGSPPTAVPTSWTRSRGMVTSS